MTRLFRVLLLCAGACAAASASAQAQRLQAQLFSSGLSLPVAFLGDPTASNRHFVVEKIGTIRVLINGVAQATPFLDISDEVADGAERGLLGMALDPDYATNRRFYVFFTRRDNPATLCNTSALTGCENGGLVLARFYRSLADPLVADESSRFDFRWGSAGGPTYIEHSEFPNHNGGSLMFGPDGYLYVGIGDGGGAYDPHSNGQSPSSFLGKMLRLDVDVADSHAQGYQVPADNPFVDDNPIDALPEIWAFGLRNPWKFSFDDPSRGGTGALVIADVGQDRWEEINHEPAGMGGRNYGWRIREGSRPEPHVPQTVPAWGTLASLTNPVFEYSHVAGEALLQGRSVTGGFIYRGSDLSAMWRGRYFFADFASMRIWSAQIAPGTGAFSSIIDHTSTFGAMNVSSFGLDQRGELYIVRYGGVNQGRVYRLCEFTITPGVTSFASTGGTGTAMVSTQPGCVWNVSANAPWVAVISNAQTTGSGLVTFRVGVGGTRSSQLTIAGQGVTISQSSALPVHGDIDGNMRADLLWQHDDGRLAAWLMNGTTLSEGRPLGPEPLTDPDWRIAASGDFDRDGSRDLILQHQTDGRLALWRMSGTTLLGGSALSPAQVADTDWKIRAAADMNRDGWMDLLWQHEGNGSVAVWLMVGSQLRDGHLLTPGTVSDLNWRIVGAGDMNADGHADLVWQHQTNGLISAWLMNRSTMIRGILLTPGQVSDTDWKIRAVTDINGDRWLDLVWHNQVTGLLSVWHMNGTARAGDGLRVTPSGVADTGWQIVGPR